MYILDNEPTLWDTTHRDVHPTPVTYDELLERTIRYASEVRRADPDVMIAGPAEWGWLGYFYSAKDRVEGKFVRSDRRAHGDEPLIPWYLKQLAQYEKDTARVCSTSWTCTITQPPTVCTVGTRERTQTQAALRVRATRSLWDPSYTDESWIAEPIRLIPRLKEWIAANYPGLGISIGEWSFGADAHISGGTCNGGGAWSVRPARRVLGLLLAGPLEGHRGPSGPSGPLGTSTEQAVTSSSSPCLLGIRATSPFLRHGTSLVITWWLCS